MVRVAAMQLDRCCGPLWATGEMQSVRQAEGVFHEAERAKRQGAGALAVWQARDGMLPWGLVRGHRLAHGQMDLWTKGQGCLVGQGMQHRVRRDVGGSACVPGLAVGGHGSCACGNAPCIPHRFSFEYHTGAKYVEHSCSLTRRHRGSSRGYTGPLTQDVLARRITSSTY